MSSAPRRDERIRIFLSSTNDPETAKYRHAARQIIESEFAKKYVAVDMSDFTTKKYPPIKECQIQVLNCDVYLGLLGPFYGTVNEETGLSYTEYEYTTARNAPRDLGIFLLPEQSIFDQTPFSQKKEQFKTLERQQEFRQRVSKDHLAVFVNGDLEEFRGHLRKFLNELSAESLSFAPITPSIGVEPTTRKIEERAYKDWRDAFSDLDAHIRRILSGKQDRDIGPTEINLKLLAVAMRYSWGDVISDRIYPKLMNDYPNAIINLDILFAAPDFLNSLNIVKTPVDWGDESERHLKQLPQWYHEIEPELRGNLRLKARIYEQLPQWHGWLLDDDFLFLGRTTWDFKNRRAELRVGQSKYRYFDKTNEPGKERIKQYGDWFHFFWNFASHPVFSSDGENDFYTEAS